MQNQDASPKLYLYLDKPGVKVDLTQNYVFRGHFFKVIYISGVAGVESTGLCHQKAYTTG